MDLPRYNSSFLIRQFRDFYRDVVRFRRVVETKGYEVAAAIPQGENTAATEATGIWQQLLSSLERQALDAGRSGGAFAFEIYRESQYVMAALADEVFLHMNWEGRAFWPLLETRLFQTHIAGEAIFQRLDRLLQRRDPFYLDLAAVYFMALSLGFQGKFRDTQNLDQLVNYRRQLFSMIYRRNPKLFSSTDALFPQSYESVLDQGAGKKLADQRMWMWLVVLVLLLWLGIAHYGWRNLSGQVECLMCHITNPNCSCDIGSLQQQ